MVHLNRIYTRGGDAGETSLGDGTRVPKTEPRIAAYGGVDELNAVIGMAVAAGAPDAFLGKLTAIQNDLFDLGADLCVPETPTPEEDSNTAPPSLRVTAAQVDRLESWIDEATARLEPLTSFVLPGGTPAAAHLHHARTVCRRTEIGVAALMERESINPLVLHYLNRLSDLLFVLAREANDSGRDDVLWKPGAGRE